MNSRKRATPCHQHVSWGTTKAGYPAITTAINMFPREQRIHRNPKHLNEITPETHQHNESVRNGKETNSVYFREYSHLAKASMKVIWKAMSSSDGLLISKFNTLSMLADGEVQRNV